MAATDFESIPSLTLPDNSGGGFYCYSGLLVSAGGIISALHTAIDKGEPILLLIIPIFGIIAYLLLRSITTSTPSSICIKADTITLTNVPTFCIWLDKAIVPLIIKKQVSIKKSEFHLEWLDQSLTWNDLQGGKSIHLAHSSEAQPLLAWLTAQEIPIPQKPT